MSKLMNLQQLIRARRQNVVKSVACRFTGD